MVRSIDFQDDSHALLQDSPRGDSNMVQRAIENMWERDNILNSSITSTLMKKESHQSTHGAGDNIYTKLKKPKKNSTIIHDREPKKYIPQEEEKIR